MESRREIDTGIFIQVWAFSGENNNPTPVCVWYCQALDSFKAESEFELNLSAGDIVIVRKVILFLAMFCMLRLSY